MLLFFQKKKCFPPFFAGGHGAAGMRPPNDPLVAAAGLLGLILASNQPFYPLYVWLLTGEGAVRASVVLAALPLFAAVPWVARRWSVVGRAMLPVVGIVNTVVTVVALGAEAGVAILLVPCAALAAMLFRERERLVMLGIVALAVAAWWLVDGWLVDGLPGGHFSADGYAALRRMNAISAIALCGLIGWITPRGALPSPPPRA